MLLLENFRPPFYPGPNDCPWVLEDGVINVLILLIGLLVRYVAPGLGQSKPNLSNVSKINNSQLQLALSKEINCNHFIYCCS